MTGLLRKILRDTSGATIIEFAILAPVVITLTLGVLQVGIWMQGYNTLRAVAADASRNAVVQYQKGSRISNYEMAVWARNRAIGTGYQLPANRVSTSVTDDADQPIIGVTRKTLIINYQMSSVLGIAGISEITVSFNRPVFVSSS